MKFPPWVERTAHAVIVTIVIGALTQALLRDELHWYQAAAAPALVTVAWLSPRFKADAWTAMLAACAFGPLTAALTANDDASLGWFAVMFLAGQIGLTLPFAAGARAFAVLVATLGAEAIWVGGEGWANWFSGAVTGWVGMALFRKQAELALRSRAAEASAERQRIAHELHDVVAHTLAVTVLHLGAARVAVEHEPERAAEALAEAERLARRSMAELRQVVGVLGDGDGTAPPRPTAAGVPELVEEYRRAGVSVTSSVDGDLADIDGTRGLVLYRVTQEALANAARHAPGAPVEVVVEVGAVVRLRVGNPLPAGVVAGATGNGVTGMADRARAVGGSAVAGPMDGGWQVRLDLPGGAGG